jgi:hypothetical protein
MAMTSVQAPLFTILENHARPPVIGQEHDYPHPIHTRQTLVGHPVKDSTMSCSEEPGGGDRPPSEKPPLPPKPSTVEVCIKTFHIHLKDRKFQEQITLFTFAPITNKNIFLFLPLVS